MIAASLWVISLSLALSAVLAIAMLFYAPHHGLDEAGRHVRRQAYFLAGVGAAVHAAVIFALMHSAAWKRPVRRILGPVTVLAAVDCIVVAGVYVFVRYS